MPCRCDHMEPNKREQESVKVLTFLREVGFVIPPFGMYGRVKDVDNDTDKLCSFLKENNVKDYSLELQIWWRDHQETDRIRELEEKEAKRKAKVKKQALSKLIVILGLDKQG